MLGIKKLLAKILSLTNKAMLVDYVDHGDATIAAGASTRFTIPEMDGYTIASCTPFVTGSSWASFTAVYSRDGGNFVVYFTNRHTQSHTNRFRTIVLYVRDGLL